MTTKFEFLTRQGSKDLNLRESPYSYHIHNTSVIHDIKRTENNLTKGFHYAEHQKDRQSSEKLKEKSDKTKKFLFKQLRACDLLSPLVDGQLKAMIGEMRFETKSWN